MIKLQRIESFLESKTSSLDRFQRTLEIIKMLKEIVFPLEIGELSIEISEEPIIIKGLA